MGIISTDKNKITLIYHSESSLGKQTLGYVNSSKKDILPIDTLKTNIPETQWVEISDQLNVKVSGLIDKKHPKFKELYNSDIELDTKGWLKIISNHPEVVVNPILIIGEEFYQITNPSDFVKYIEPDSAGVSRNPSKDQ
ncbi:arsenate reductase family protein [Aquimarina sp. SS2-1]|uniref:arsenate reductase family protein n=1 Tax=Aquimarina besae TaxID=3342247 RepID=UPI00366E0E5A